MKKTERSPGLPDRLSDADVSGIIAMAWQDDTPFEAIAQQFGVTEPQVIALMRASLKARSFRLWRTRVRGRKSKHRALNSQCTASPSDRPDGRAVAGTAAADVSSDALSAAPGDLPWPPSPLTRDALR